jgi:hypothetical protein
MCMHLNIVNTHKFSVRFTLGFKFFKKGETLMSKVKVLVC